MCHSLLSPLVGQYLELSCKLPLERGIQDLNAILTAILRSMWSKSSSGRSAVYACIAPVVERNKLLLNTPAAVDEHSLQVPFSSHLYLFTYSHIDPILPIFAGHCAI